MKLILVGIGGFLGAILRYMASLLLNRDWQRQLPWGTLLVNVLGGFLIGFIICMPMKKSIEEKIKLMVCTGFLGGLTTFSTFGLETVTYIKEGMLTKGLLNIVLQLGCTLIAVALGLMLGRMVTK